MKSQLIIDFENQQELMSFVQALVNAGLCEERKETIIPEKVMGPVDTTLPVKNEAQEYRVCPNCDKKFIPKRKDSTCCSIKCSQAVSVKKKKALMNS